MAVTCNGVFIQAVSDINDPVVQGVIRGSRATPAPFLQDLLSTGTVVEPSTTGSSSSSSTTVAAPKDEEMQPNDADEEMQPKDGNDN